VRIRGSWPTAALASPLGPQIWKVVGAFFTVNMFVSVVVDSFNRIKGQSDGSATMTPGQQQWVNTVKAVVRQKPLHIPRPPKNELRRRLYDLVRTTAFEAVVFSAIGANLAVMACDYWQIEQNPTHMSLYNNLENSLTWVFYIEVSARPPPLRCRVAAQT
jgi:hypothetical protein